MPNLSKKTRKETESILNSMNIEYNIKGNGDFVSQSPMAGKKLTGDETITINYQKSHDEESSEESLDEGNLKTNNKKNINNENLKEKNSHKKKKLLKNNKNNLKENSINKKSNKEDKN